MIFNLKIKNKILVKIIKYLAITLAIVIILPYITKNKSKEVSSDNVTDEIKYFNYGDYTNINLLHTDSKEIENISLDEYLLGVVSAEMPASYEIEALKAQAVVARTYTIYQIKNSSKHENADICDSSLCCQAWISKENRLARWEEEKQDEYWNKIVESVSQTVGKVILYNGEPINAFFHSNSGGKTEIPEYVWGGSYPYLEVVETSGEDAYSTYSSEMIISKDELISKMLEQYSDFSINFENDEIKILEYTDSGRIKKIKIGNKELSGIEARKIFGLKSAKFSVQIIENEIKFSVIGNGHGVGLSQSGSDSLAKQGYNYEEIIKHYYKDVEISE
jgi:stage II sporulation protein D